MKLVDQRSIVKSLSGLFVVVLLGSVSPSVNAQYLVSTKAGFVNKVEGRVLIQRQENEDGEPGRVSLGTQMKDGDLLITQARGRAEILLTPGSYLRLYEGCEVRAVNTSLAAPRFSIVKGSVIIETAQITKGTAIQIDTPNGPVSVGREGIQRIDVTENGSTVSVRQGEVVLGTSDQLLAKNATKIGRGKMLRLGTSALAPGEQPLIAKVNKDGEADDFDLWSYNRAQLLMQANSSALRRSSLSDSMALGWFYDPFYNFYTFMPGRRLFFSQYGFPFFSRYSDYSYYFPYGYGAYGYAGYGYGYRGGTQPGNAGGGGGGSIPGRVIAGNERVPIARAMAEREVRASESRTSGGERGISTGVSSPSGGTATVSAPSSAVSISAPAARGGDSGGSAPAARPARP
jgi:hypothetical protein